MLCNGETIIQLPTLRVQHLQRLVSDYSQLLVSVAHQIPYRSRLIFQRMWTDHHGLEPLVEQIWSEHVVGSLSFRLAKNLPRLKRKLKSWNWDTFGDLKVKTEQNQNQIEALEERLQTQWKWTRKRLLCAILNFGKVYVGKLILCIRIPEHNGFETGIGIQSFSIR